MLLLVWNIYIWADIFVTTLTLHHQTIVCKTETGPQELHPRYYSAGKIYNGYQKLLRKLAIILSFARIFKGERLGSGWLRSRQKSSAQTRAAQIISGRNRCHVKTLRTPGPNSRSWTRKNEALTDSAVQPVFQSMRGSLLIFETLSPTRSKLRLPKPLHSPPKIQKLLAWSLRKPTSILLTRSATVWWRPSFETISWLEGSQVKDRIELPLLRGSSGFSTHLIHHTLGEHSKSWLRPSNKPSRTALHLRISMRKNFALLSRRSPVSSTTKRFRLLCLSTLRIWKF